MPEKLTILSTFAKDILIDERTGSKAEQAGGPALYLTKVFQQENIPVNVISPPEMRVEILLNDKGEFGKVPERAEPVKVDFKKIETDYLVISTLLDDFSLDGLEKYQGRVFVDLQGFVRDGTDFGKKKKWEPAPEIQNKIFCLKGTDEELSYLKPEFVENQKKKILLRTLGKNGAEIYYFGAKFVTRPAQIIEPKNTIGAGDTYFAYFILKFAETGDVKVSAEYASDKVSEFLIEIH